MNRGLNLPSIQRIMNEFEKESATMDMKEEMMSDAVDDVMDDEAEDEEEEGDKILKEVLDEIGVGLQQQLNEAPSGLGTVSTPVANSRLPVAIGEGDGPVVTPRGKGSGDEIGGSGGGGGGGGGGGVSEEDALQARLNNLRRG